MDCAFEQPLENGAFTCLYKYNGYLESSQRQRRENFLEKQRHKRHEIADKNRELAAGVIDELNVEDEMEFEEVEQPTKNKLKYKLMLSEWFTEVPHDLEENWLVKFCPQGFRVLLIAHKKRTIVSTENGIILNIISNFPGGGGATHYNKGITVLDCIFNKMTKTIFVLDCLVWNSMSMLDSETGFRFYWLKSKFDENLELTKYKKYNFILLENLPAHRPLIQDKMSTLLSIQEHTYPYDGVVFYHKESHYTFGYTPLVGWLAAYMLPEKLHVDVSPLNMVRKPKDYSNMEIHLQNLREKNKSRHSNQQLIKSETESP